MGHIRPYLDLAGDAMAARVKQEILKSAYRIHSPSTTRPLKAAEIWLLDHSDMPYIHWINNIQLYPCAELSKIAGFTSSNSEVFRGANQ
jgi:hypothetical protein